MDGRASRAERRSSARAPADRPNERTTERTTPAPRRVPIQRTDPRGGTETKARRPRWNRTPIEKFPERCSPWSESTDRAMQGFFPKPYILFKHTPGWFFKDASIRLPSRDGRVATDVDEGRTRTDRSNDDATMSTAMTPNAATMARRATTTRTMGRAAQKIGECRPAAAAGCGIERRVARAAVVAEATRGDGDAVKMTRVMHRAMIAGAGRRETRGRRRGTAPRANATADKGEVWKARGKDALNAGLLLALFMCWYGFNIVFNIYNKQILKSFPYPVTVTLIELGVGSALIAAMWASGAKKPPTLNKEMLKPIVPLAVIHTVGNLLTNVSLGKVAVSFTHTIKAMEPFFSVLLSALFLGDIPSLAVMGALVPVVGGVALASITEVSFNWAGFLSAMGSNITFQSRNVLSKKMMGLSSIKGAIDNINLFSVITMLSCLVCLPIAVGIEGVRFTPSAMAAVGVSFQELAKRLLIAGFCFQMYQQISYMILSRVSPVTHSVGNCMKRVTVIVVTLLYFKNPVSSLNMAGTALALFGVFLYSRVKRAEGEKKKASAAVSAPSAASGDSAYTDEFRRITGLVNIE